MLTVYKDSRDLLWIGHPHGLSIWNQKNDSIYFLDQKNGLAANLVRAITEDNNNQMWIGTGNGISRIKITNDPPPIVNFSVRHPQTAERQYTDRYSSRLPDYHSTRHPDHKL